MAQLRCRATCYMPAGVDKDGKPVKVLDRYEDVSEDEYEESDPDMGVYEIHENLVRSFLATGNFELIHPLSDGRFLKPETR